ncbi:hypothetical protein FB566_4866 [Stackebrandtia endophytica]|uniref:Acyltransferase n=1 Tax=Stackebrandtia endophytica TaxID=1496996 RepID=A0A543B341_9ACTN|nr:acyltransferase domain-containing protein [Stackebrandtia endophytica]TQL79265.1 hypothetical protein FB566_4866 [Stackebrandtia endophytica]
MESQHLIDRLGLAETDWYQRWNGLPPSTDPVPLPTASEAERLLVERLGADPVDAAAVAAARPDPRRDPELWWVLDRCYRQLSDDMGGVGMLLWPKLPEDLGATGRFVYLWALLAVLPQTLEYHRSRGVPQEVTWATLGNVGEKLRLNRARYGEPGLAVVFWFTLHFRGSIFRLGRLEFAMERLGDSHPFTGHRAGEMTLGMHIPGEGGPLSAASCRESVEWADRFFPEHFGDLVPADPMYTCTSWLLDPQLGDHLPVEANIVRFGRCFDLVAASPTAAVDGEKDVLQFVFDHIGPYDAAALPRDSTLRRVLADGLARGVAWQVRSGVWRRD